MSEHEPEVKGTITLKVSLNTLDPDNNQPAGEPRYRTKEKTIDMNYVIKHSSYGRIVSVSGDTKKAMLSQVVDLMVSWNYNYMEFTYTAYTPFVYHNFLKHDKAIKKEDVLREKQLIINATNVDVLRYDNERDISIASANIAEVFEQYLYKFTKFPEFTKKLKETFDVTLHKKERTYQGHPTTTQHFIETQTIDTAEGATLTIDVKNVTKYAFVDGPSQEPEQEQEQWQGGKNLKKTKKTQASASQKETKPNIKTRSTKKETTSSAKTHPKKETKTRSTKKESTQPKKETKTRSTKKETTSSAKTRAKKQTKN